MRSFIERMYVDPEGIMDDVCAHESNGGSVIDLCEEWNIKWSTLHMWITSDDDRNKQWVASGVAQCEWVKQRTLHELRKIAFIDATQLYDDTGQILPMSEWSAAAKAAVVSIKKTDARRDKDGYPLSAAKVEVKVVNKLQAIELLGKNLSLFNDRLDVTITKTLEELVEESIDVEAKAVTEEAHMIANDDEGDDTTV